MKQDELFRLHPERKYPKPPPKRLNLTRPEPKEAPILASVLQALNFYPNVIWHARLNSGAYAVGEGKARRFIRFGFPGCPDILGMMRGGKLLAIEVKSHLGLVSDHQEAFLSMVNANGGVAFVCRGIDDLKQHLGGNHDNPTQ